MSPARVSSRTGKRPPVRHSPPPRPVTLPTFAFYGHAPVTYRDGALVIGSTGKGRP